MGDISDGAANYLKHQDGVEAGVYVTLKALGISEPTTAKQRLAVRLARAIDNAKYAKDLPPLAGQLRQTLDEIRDEPTGVTDDLDDMQSRY